MTPRFTAWYDLPDVAARLGVSVMSVRRALKREPVLHNAARFVLGQWRLPEAAVLQWIESHPRYGSLDRRNVVPRPATRVLAEPAVARSEGELRRKLGVQTSGQEAGHE